MPRHQRKHRHHRLCAMIVAALVAGWFWPAGAGAHGRGSDATSAQAAWVRLSAATRPAQRRAGDDQAEPVRPLDHEAPGWIEPRDPPDDGRFSLPLPPPHHVVRPFHAPTTPYGPGHRGVDLAATPGTPVLAAGDGVVMFAGRVVDREVIAIDHDAGLRTAYEPVVPSVAAGARVRRGEQIGVLAPGHPGCPAEACLHWSLRRDGRYLEPLWLIRPPRVRLLPMEPDVEPGVAVRGSVPIRVRM